MSEMTAQPIRGNDAAKIFAWLEKRSSRETVPVRIHRKAARTDGDYLYVPVRVEGDLDAYEKAQLMQTMEDEWNYQDPSPARKILLIPTAN
jgi:hypothetical protein